MQKNKDFEKICVGVPPEQVARQRLVILRTRRPAMAYALNRNPLLRLLNILPARRQLFLIRRILR